jgi:glycosyltransferase involved in cell wall biosynthesis
MFFSGVYVLARKPWVLGVADNSLATASKLAQSVGIKPHFLVFRTWYGGDLRGGIAALRILARAQFPRVTWMCNALAEVTMLRVLGQRAIFCHHNLFCNENTFNIQANPIEYDAIYIARLDAYKRLWLASDIPKLRIITANPLDKERLRPWGCDHANINENFLNYQSIALEINKAACGLALSKKEGGMLATTEYLLCGKPVVSTPSRGGREYWLDQLNHLIVAADSSAIADAVLGMDPSKMDPILIRAGTLERLFVQRRILFDYVCQLATSASLTSVGLMSGDWLHSQYVHQTEITKILTTGH